MVAIDVADMSRSIPIEEASCSKITFSQALLDKYVNQEEFDNGLVLPGDKIISTDITFVGFSTVSSVQRQLHKLTNLDLSGRRIEAAGSLKDLDGKLINVRTLNLGDNHLPWHQVALISSYLPNLRELILTSNRLDLDPEVEIPPPIKSLASITLGRTTLGWRSIVVYISRIWFYVEQIDLWGSGLNGQSMAIGDTSGLEPAIKQLRTLWLSHNHFSNLDFLSQVGPIQNLEELDISNCGLNTIAIDYDLAHLLANLRVLNISYNNLSDWRSISNLYKLKKLKNLICHENPVFITEKLARALTIGRLDKLNFLNREEITQKTRRDSEILYLRRTFPEYQAFKNDEYKDFPLDHPRYDELLNIYGVPEDLIKAQVVEKYINVEMCYCDKRENKKLPCDMRVANVKMLCKRLFKLKPSCRIQIMCKTGSPDNDINYVLDKDCQTLDFFSVKSGHKLYIEEIK